jgi:23S rRNA pseudouridine955/2504/2580 synthase
VISTVRDKALLEVELLTGRTHQIRAHMAFVGHPLVGDGKYGKNEADRKQGLKYQSLCSYKLRFSFEGECGALGYLGGKEICIPKDKIFFTKEFFGGSKNDEL